MISRQLVMIVLIIEAVLLAGLVVGYAVVAVRMTRRGRRLSRARVAMHGAVSQLVTEGPSDDLLVMLRRVGVADQARVVGELANSVQGAAVDFLARRLGLVNRAARWSRARRWHRRLRGLRVLDAAHRGTEAVFDRVSDRHPAVRAQALAMLDPRSDIGNVGLLLRALADGDRRVRHAAKLSLVRGGRQVVPQLERALRAGTGHVVALADALEVAAAIGDPDFVPVGRQYAVHDVAIVRRQAVRLLAGIGGPRAVAMLRHCMSDADPYVRTIAIDGLGRAASRDDAAAIAGYLDDDAWQVRRASALALRRLGSTGILLLRAVRRGGNVRAAKVASYALLDVEHAS